MTLFDYFDSVSKTKTYLEPDAEYSPFFINRGLSQHLDTLFDANKMNLYGKVLDGKLHYDYLFYKIKKSNRYGKWAKRENSEVIDSIRQFYRCSYKKAVEYSVLLNTEALQNIQKHLEKGGLKK
jgi:hypothetical protein